LKVAYVTGGTVGAGHLMRGVAVRNALVRAGARVDFTMLGPPLPFENAIAAAGYRAVEMKPEPLMREVTARTSPLAQALVALAPDLVVVDLFWAPLRFVLPLLQAEAWLLVRRCPDAWLDGPPGLPFLPAQYARRFAIEPMDSRVPLEPLAPIVVCNPDECRSGGAAEDLIVHAGKPGELDVLRAAAPPGARAVSLWDAGAPFPVAPLLPSARSVTCGAGYNAYWESRWLGHFPRTRFVPFERSIDDQPWRLLACADYAMRENGADVLARAITGLRLPRAQ
jgi:hypothetical protein